MALCIVVYLHCVLDNVYQVSFFNTHSGDTKNVLTGSADNSCRLWDCETGMLRMTAPGYTCCASGLILDPPSALGFAI